MIIKNIKNLLHCPNCKNEELVLSEKELFCNQCKEQYPVISDIPILITKNRCIELGLNYHNTNIQNEIINSNDFQKNKNGVLNYIKNILIGTNGILYRKIKEPKKYPIANIPFHKIDKDNKQMLLDIGCGWGRWTINAAQKNYTSVGIDLSLKSLLVAQTISKELNIQNSSFICCDVLDLPLRKNLFDKVFSFSFLQHFSENKLRIILKNISLTMKKNSIFKTQMINKYSVRGLYNDYRIRNNKNEMVKKGHMDDIEGENSFTVRYFSVNKINKILNETFNIENFKNYSFFTQAQLSDFTLVSLKSKFFLIVTLVINTLVKVMPFFKFISDNLLFTLKKRD